MDNILKKILSQVNPYSGAINESNLSRVYDFLRNKDCAILTAWRSEFTHEVNVQINKELSQTLLGLKYGCTKVQGGWIEGFNTDKAVQHYEDSTFVVNLLNDSNFTNNIISLGKKYDQDSVLIKEKNSDEAYLFGTSKRENSYPGYGVKKSSGVFHGGKESQFMSKIKSRPFMFESVLSYGFQSRSKFEEVVNLFMKEKDNA